MHTIKHQQSAPITDAAWTRLEEAAADYLRPRCTARQFCHIDGPHGLDLAAVNTGELVTREANDGDCSWGTRASLPIIESRVSFSLPVETIRSLPRGATDADLTALETAAGKMARFEDDTVYHGRVEAGVRGCFDSFTDQAVEVDLSRGELVEGVGRARSALERSGFGEHLKLVLGRDAHEQLNRVHTASGRSTRELLGCLIDEADMIIAPALDHSLLVSTVGHPFVLTVGQDICLQFVEGDEQSLQFCFLETFTFRVDEPRAGIVLRTRDDATEVAEAAAPFTRQAG